MQNPVSEGVGIACGCLDRSRLAEPALDAATGVGGGVTISALDPPALHTAVPNWPPGDTIPLGPDQTLRVIEVRHGGYADHSPVPVVKSA